MTRSRLLLFSLCCLPFLGGCTTVASPPEYEVDRRAVYQRIANALPLADWGWGTPPGVAVMSKSARDEGPAPEVEPLTANEKGFRVRLQVYRERTVWIPYTAITQVRHAWRTFPNVLFIPLLIVPLQWVDTEVVLDTSKIDGFDARINADTKRMEQISREIGLGGPWSFAQQVKAKVADDAAVHGAGKLVLRFGYVIPAPPYIPLGGPAEETAVAFAWAQAHPDEPTLEPIEKSGPKDEVRTGSKDEVRTGSKDEVRTGSKDEVRTGSKDEVRTERPKKP